MFYKDVSSTFTVFEFFVYVHNDVRKTSKQLFSKRLSLGEFYSRNVIHLVEDTFPLLGALSRKFMSEDLLITR